MNIYFQQISELSINNKYLKWYIHIIMNTKYKDGYGEKHHILPKCFKLGGEKDDLNIAKLTAREHYICHLLLTKMLNDVKKTKQMINAYLRMSTSKTSKNKRTYKINPILYTAAKTKNSALMSGILNHNGDGRQAKSAWAIASPERRLNQARVMADVNKLYKTKPKEFRTYVCIKCKTQFIKEEFCHHERKIRIFCSRKCSCWNTGLTTKI